MLASFADVLHVDAASLTARSDFFALGGDSLKCMRAVAAAKRRGLRLSISQVAMTNMLPQLISCHN